MPLYSNIMKHNSPPSLRFIDFSDNLNHVDKNDSNDDTLENENSVQSAE